jgi:PKD repeat protein
MFGHDPERTYNPYAKGGRIYPDLTIGPQDITFDPIVANGAIKANVTITYHNQGPIPTGEFNITLTKDGTNLTTFDVLSVPAFSDGKATYKWNVNYENSTLDVALDSGKVVSELRESNNKASRTLSMNLRPVADAGPDIRTDPRKAIILDGSKSKDLDGDVVSYVWDFGDGTTAKGPVVTHGFNKSGPSNVVLTVTDEYGATGSDNRTVWVNHVPTITDWRPKSNTTLNEGENIVFWVMTGDTDGDKVAVTWYLDGVPMAQGNSWSWWANYSSAGTHLVAASASDGSLVTNKTWTITVIDSGRLIQDATPPTPVTIPEGQTQQFSVVLSGAAQDAQIDWYLDGHIVQSGTAGFAIYAGPGTQGHHDLELRVQADNAWDYFYWNITIGPKADIPRIRWAFPDTANITTVFGTPVYMGISSEGGSVQWYVDGKARVGQNDPSFRFDIWGNSSYNVTVIVSSGTNSVFRIWIINIEHPPIANIQPSALNVKINKKVDLDGKNSKAYKATDVITSYQWDFGDGTTGTGQAVKHAYKRAGGYQVTLNVTDSKGMTASTSVTLVVQPAPQASTPGFEGIFLFLAVAITALAVARRRQI